MTGRVELQYSKTRVKKAGETLRAYWVGGDPGREAVYDALDVLDNFRAAHRYSLGKARGGLQSMVRAEGGGDVSQRLKRQITIIDKLARIPGMRLDRMQDIAGCRAVVNTLTQVRAIEDRWEQRGRVRYKRDYIAEPADDGYRSLHVIVEYDERLVEVQVRTRVQHEWATTVERAGGQIAQDLKSGIGPPAVLSFFRVVSEAMAIDEAGGTVPADLLAQVQALRPKAVAIIVDQARGGTA